MLRYMRVVTLILTCSLILLLVATTAAAPLRQGDPAGVLTAARLDLETLADERLGAGVRPPGWSDINQIDPATFTVSLRLDLENLAANLLGPDLRPSDWFGTVPGTSWSIARDIRHDLELLADALSADGARPALWIGDDPLMSCGRGVQAMIGWFEQTNPAYSRSAFSAGPAYCQQVGDEANLFAEILVSGTPPAGNLRVDLNALNTRLIGEGVFPEGWAGGSDNASVRADLELLRTASAQVGSPVDAASWFGGTVGADWVIARAARHDLEILADAKLGPGSRPSGWSNSDVLVRCPRSTQNLAAVLQAEAGYTPTLAASGGDVCRAVEWEASLLAERAAQPQPAASTAPSTAPASGPAIVFPDIPTDAALTYGTSVQGTIDDSAWSRIYSFEGNSGDSVTVAMRADAGSLLDPAVIVFDPFGSAISGNDDSGGSLDARLTVLLPGAGRYYLVATRYEGEEGDSTGAFTLQINGTPTGSLLGSGGAEAITYGGTAESSLSNTTWFRAYRFEGYAGDEVAVVMNDSSGGNLDPYLILLDEAENVIASDDDSGGALNPLLTVTLPQTGTYTILATRYLLNLPGDDVMPNEGPFMLQLNGTRAAASAPAAAPADGQGGGGAVATVGGISGAATTPFAYFDPLADQYAGQIPRGTPFTAIARRGAEVSRMMLVQGEGFVLWIAWPWTNLTEEQYMSLPLADDLIGRLPQLLCYAAFCTRDVHGGDPLTGLTGPDAGQGYAGVGAPGGNLGYVDNAHVRILFNADLWDQGYAEFRIELCSAPGSVNGCEPVLRFYESGQLVQPIRIENGYPVYRMSYNLHESARLESSHFYTTQFWVPSPSTDRRD